MTEQTPDSAAGASRRGAPAAGSLRPATDLSAASRQLLSGGSRQLDSAALRDALLDLHEFWLTTKAAEIGITPTSGFAIVATSVIGAKSLTVSYGNFLYIPGLTVCPEFTIRMV